MSFRNVLDKSPIQISTAVVVVLNLLIIADIVNVEAAVVAGLNGAIVSVLGLFVATKTANKAVLNEIQESFEQEGA